MKIFIFLGFTMLIAISLFYGPPKMHSNTSPVDQSFQQYFDPKVLRAVDKLMKKDGYNPDSHWRIGTYGIYKHFEKNGTGDIEIVVNWDGYYYKKGNYRQPLGDWTTLK